MAAVACNQPQQPRMLTLMWQRSLRMKACLPACRSRSGAAAVEMAMVLPMVILFVFGIYEYGRFVFTYTTATNAVRDGCRYAIVNTQTLATSTDVQTVVNNKMAGLLNTINSYNVTVFYADPSPSGLAASPPVLQDNPLAPAPNGWKTTPFPDKIAVQMTGVYRPVVAQVVQAPVTINLNVSSVMTSED
jgi:Flp pilus assembly protein TadG